MDPVQSLTPLWLIPEEDGMLLLLVHVLSMLCGVAEDRKWSA